MSLPSSQFLPVHFPEQWQRYLSALISIHDAWFLHGSKVAQAAKCYIHLEYNMTIVQLWGVVSNSDTCL